MPSPAPTSLAAAVPDLVCRGWIGAAAPDAKPAQVPPGVAVGPVVNVHRLRDGVYVGRLGPALALDPGALLEYLRGGALA